MVGDFSPSSRLRSFNFKASWATRCEFLRRVELDKLLEVPQTSLSGNVERSLGRCEKEARERSDRRREVNLRMVMS